VIPAKAEMGFVTAIARRLKNAWASVFASRNVSSRKIVGTFFLPGLLAP
jgi:hypothetical protein